MSVEANKAKRSATPAWASMAVLLALSVVFGLFILPRMRASHSKLVGIPAPAFALPVLDEGSGNRLALRDLRGKAVLLDFWASWCGPCREQVTIVDDVAQRFSDRELTVIGVNTGDEKVDALAFLKSRSLSYASVFDETRETTLAYEVKTLPTLILIDKDGRIAAVRSSVVSRRELEQLVKDVLAPPS
jgi:cytochrome c biogenesis protein CcmG, thiol:disulfide interchange protein DsbE